MSAVFALEQAKRRMEAGTPCHPDYYGKGWSVYYAAGEFWDRNPVTGSSLLHTFDQRDEAANWREGPQKRNPSA